MEVLYAKIMILLSCFFSTGQEYETIKIQENIVTIEFEDGTVRKHRITMIPDESLDSGFLLCPGGDDNGKSANAGSGFTE